MCTAISLNNFFGRNLDNEFSFEESVAITPRNYELKFRLEKTIQKHFSFIGTAYVKDGYPLYYDGTNEKGLSVAGLSFYEAEYSKNECEGKYNISPFEFIPWLLSQCEDIKSAKKLIENTNLIAINYSDDLPLTPLHFIVSDINSSIVAEPIKGEIKLHENVFGVLTNSPEFPFHEFTLSLYTNLSNEPRTQTFPKEKAFTPYSKGLGALGLPGDFSSLSRFVKAVFLKNFSPEKETKVTHFFRLLESVSMPSGAVKTEKGFEKTIYTSCCETKKGVYYYKTYFGSRITAVNMYNENLDGESVISYPFRNEEDILFEN